VQVFENISPFNGGLLGEENWFHQVNLNLFLSATS